MARRSWNAGNWQPGESRRTRAWCARPSRTSPATPARDGSTWPSRHQYKFAPIKVRPGQRVRVWVLDAGPSENSSFHIVGTIFDTVFREGHYELRPDATHGG